MNALTPTLEAFFTQRLPQCSRCAGHGSNPVVEYTTGRHPDARRSLHRSSGVMMKTSGAFLTAAAEGRAQRPQLRLHVGDEAVDLWDDERGSTLMVMASVREWDNAVKVMAKLPLATFRPVARLSGSGANGRRA